MEESSSEVEAPTQRDRGLSLEGGFDTIQFMAYDPAKDFLLFGYDLGSDIEIGMLRLSLLVPSYPSRYLALSPNVDGDARADWSWLVRRGADCRAEGSRASSEPRRGLDDAGLHLPPA